MPGVTLVSSAKAQEAGYRKPITAATARRRWRLPVLISSETGEPGKRRSSAPQRGPASQTRAPMLTADQRPLKTGQGSAPNGKEELGEDGRVQVGIVTTHRAAPVEVRVVELPVDPRVLHEVALVEVQPDPGEDQPSPGEHRDGDVQEPAPAPRAGAHEDGSGHGAGSGTSDHGQAAGGGRGLAASG